MRHLLIRISIGLLTLSVSGCYIFNFVDGQRASPGEASGAVFSGTVAGQPLGEKAGGLDSAALAEVYAVESPHSPAAVRPDPDLYVRRMLRQYRSEGATVARQIGRVEQFRLLLGGATEDFSKQARDTYDATSLLAVFKVAEEVCRGLVAPNAYEHEGWATILPYEADSERQNVVWLAQRFLGRPSSTIPDESIESLIAIMEAEEPFLTEWWATETSFAKYIAVCATLALDAEALYL